MTLEKIPEFFLTKSQIFKLEEEIIEEDIHSFEEIILNTNKKDIYIYLKSHNNIERIPIMGIKDFFKNIEIIDYKTSIVTIKHSFSIEEIISYEKIFYSTEDYKEQIEIFLPKEILEKEKEEKNDSNKFYKTKFISSKMEKENINKLGDLFIFNYDGKLFSFLLNLEIDKKKFVNIFKEIEKYIFEGVDKNLDTETKLNIILNQIKYSNNIEIRYSSEILKITEK